MNTELINNLDKYYAYAERISKDLGKDIVHHLATEIPEDVKHPSAYIKTCIRNSFFNKRSTFNKLYLHAFEDELQEIEDITVHFKTYDAILLHKIFLEMEIEGNTLEVSIFKDCYLGSSIREFSNETNIDRRIITKICKFVQDEVFRRYTELDSH